MNFWRHLFRRKADAAKAAEADARLEVAVETNRVARATVAVELEKIMRGLADDLRHAADNLGGRHDRK